MSEDEADVEYEEEAEAEEAPRQEKTRAPKPLLKRDDAEKKSEAEALMQAQKKKHEEDEALKLKEYEEQRRIQREKEEEELRQLKEKQERRRQEREEEERLFAEKRREEEEKRRHEEEERKKKADEEKRKKEEEKKKRQAMMAGLKSSGVVNLEIPHRDANAEKFNKFGNIVKAKAEMGLTKEQHEEQKRRHLQDIVKELSVDNLDEGALRAKLKEMHQRICKLEASKYDLEKRKERQEYDLKELNERQRQIARNKALKKGLDPDSATSSRHPPKVPVSSKYDRQIDRRSYGDRRYLFQSDKTDKEKQVFHGSCRPPSEWGRKENEELEQIRKNLEPPKYVEAVKLENVKPPAPYIPPTLPEDEVVEVE